MPWTYSISQRLLTGPTGARISEGYSGNGAGLNNPQMQDVPDVGPIPVGEYLIGDLQATHPKLGLNVLPLIPNPDNDMYGRSDFYMHGDNPEVDFSASKGCIVLPPWARMEVAKSDDRVLNVVA